jgi:hypothetical protein
MFDDVLVPTDGSDCARVDLVVGAIAAALWFTRGTWKEVVINEERAGSSAEAESVVED